MTGGFFVTFEGGEGTGKSTQAKLLAERLESNGTECVLTREPGGAPGAEQIRNLLVTGDVDRWSPEAECLLNYAARDDHLRRLIRPALGAGKTVICDRFMDSTRAYQGIAGGVDAGLIGMLEEKIVASTRPDLTIIFDMDPQEALARTSGRQHGAEDRFERKPSEYHEKLRKAFLAIAAANKERCHVLDAGRPSDVVSDEIWQVVDKFRARA